MKAAAAGIGSNAVTSDRVVGFDLLRGVCAVAVAIYHVLAWNDRAHLYTWGTYGVYIFFVLSGASMWVAYAHRLASGFDLTRFLGLRLLRLAPLYVLAVLAGLALQFHHSGLDAQAAREGFLNLAFQFGLGSPGATSRVTGGWSLGIEFVFYLLFPVFLALMSGRWWWLTLVLAFASQHVFIAAVFGNGKGLVEDFASYSQFLAFVFYFAAGCAIGRGIVAQRLRVHWLGVPLLVGSLAVLATVSGTSAEATLTGVAGVGLSLLAALAVAASATIPLGSTGTWVAQQLGTASYGVYILHPFIQGPARWACEVAGLGTSGLVVLTVIGSVLLALALEHWYERPVRAYFKARTRV